MDPVNKLIKTIDGLSSESQDSVRSIISTFLYDTQMTAHQLADEVQLFK